MSNHLRTDLISASKLHFKAHIEKHRINIENLLDNYHSLNVPSKDIESWRFNVVYGMLWPRGRVIREQNLHLYNKFSSLIKPDRLIIEHVIPKELNTISIDLPPHMGCPWDLPCHVWRWWCHQVKNPKGSHGRKLWPWPAWVQRWLRRNSADGELKSFSDILHFIYVCFIHCDHQEYSVALKKFWINDGIKIIVKLAVWLIWLPQMAKSGRTAKSCQHRTHKFDILMNVYSTRNITTKLYEKVWIRGQWTNPKFIRGGRSSLLCICACSAFAFLCRFSSTFECIATIVGTGTFEILRLPVWRRQWTNPKPNNERNLGQLEKNTAKTFQKTFDLQATTSAADP